MPELEPRLVSIADAAALLGIGRSKAYELARAGRLPTVDLDGRRLVPLHALDTFVAELGTREAV
jgi:excisionase family DNA binding protein